MNINNELITGLVSAASVITAIGKGIGIVKEGQLGSKTRFGRAIRGTDGKIQVIQPGFVLLVPFMHSIQKVHIRMDSLELSNLNVTLKNGLSYQYSAFVAYHVSGDAHGLEKYLYKVEDPHLLISQKLSSEIREILTNEADPLQATGAAINSHLKSVMEAYMEENLGVILDSCGLTSLTESAQAQQVNVTIAKVNYAKSIYLEENIPESVLAACFGATPVTTTSIAPVLSVSNKKDKSLMDKVTEMFNSDAPAAKSTDDR